MRTAIKINTLTRYGTQVLLGLAVVFAAGILSHQPVEAVSQTAAATPSTITHGGPSQPFGGFQHVTPSTGNWTSTTTPLQEGTVGAYIVPQLTSTCEAAEVTSLVATIEDTSIVLGGATQSLAGIMMFMVDTTSATIPAPALPVASVSSGAVWVGNNNITARGITHGFFTTSPVPIPGSIAVSFNTTGMTAADYNNLAVTVQHDLLDGFSGFVTSVTSSQPTVSVVTNDAPCYTSPAAANDSSAATQGNTITVSAEDGLLKNDNGEETTVTAYTQPSHGTVSVSPDGSYTYTPNPGFTGTDTFTYTITDAFGRTAAATVTITISPIPGPPAAGSNSLSAVLLGSFGLLTLVFVTLLKKPLAQKILKK